MEQKCNWCGFEVANFHPFCLGCGVSQQNALEVQPYVRKGINPERIVIDPTDGHLLQKNSRWIDLSTPDGRSLAIKVNQKNVIKLKKMKKKGQEFYSKVLGIDRQGLVLISNMNSQETWIASVCFGYAFFHQELFGMPPQIGSATKSRIILDQKNQWRCDF